MPPKRMTANPVKPSRHRAGKATGASDSSDSDSDAEATATSAAEPPKKRTIAPPPKVSGPGRVISTARTASRPVPIDDAARRAAAAKKLADVERKAREDGFVTESEGGSEEDDDDAESSSGEEGSSEEEDSSEEEETRRPVMVRPKFISKAKREQQQQQQPEVEGAPKRPDEQGEEADSTRRRAEADALVEAQIQKDIAARAAGKKHWDDDSGSEGGGVDDTDDVDPAAEQAAWRLREIRRIVRAREVIEAREKELAEKERRQNLTEEERRAEDDARLAAQREEKEGRGKMGFMQKYYHKGAFFQDEGERLGLAGRDIMGARFADEIKNRELLPQALQMRDMTKLGKKGATKYKDLKSEDTGQWGRIDDPRRQRSEWDRYGDGNRDGDRRGTGDYGANGANAMPLGARKERDRSREREDRGNRDSRRRDVPRSRSPRRRDRSQSRSPRQRDRDGYRENRKRDYSRERNRHDDDKRRRVDTR